jgi:hypothetical protein
VPPSPPKAPSSTKIGAEDLKHLGPVHQLLTALNDPFASRGKIEMLIRSIPVLSARILVQAREQWPTVDQLSQALTRFGNRGLERILLEFLEDLTIYKSEHEDPA